MKTSMIPWPATSVLAGLITATTLVLGASRVTAEDRPDIVIADFEGADYGNWKPEGEAFGSGPAQGALPGQQEVSGFKGKGLVNSFNNGDGTTGTLTSPEFKIERKAIKFLIGGGGFAKETFMELLVDGKAVRTATGPNTTPGGSEKLSPRSWDVSELQGKQAVIRIVDRRTGGWGHINVDDIVETDEAASRKKTVATANANDPSEIVIADFEGEDYGDWKAEGEAFGSGPAQGKLPGQQEVSGFKGKGLVNSFNKGDDTTGTLTSPAFKIERKFISFLIGGGKGDKLALQLLVDGKVVRTATGPNDKPGGSEALAQESWDVSEFAGKTGVIQVVDQATGGWGHINVDQIVQTDRKTTVVLADVKREFKINTRYLNLPIKNGATKRTVTVLVNDRAELVNTIELADAEPDWWAVMDVGAWRGKSVALQVDKLPDDSQALKQIEPGDAIKGAENLYREPLRGQFHFSPQRGWNNDPNGMVYFNGEYHLFFQHNPYGWAWGNMHWGHAVSRDLVHWEELGDVLAPDELGTMYSGSAVVDWNNTSGFGKPGQPAQVLLYTAAGNPTVQCLAYSTDGRNYTKFNGNPVVPQITGGNRDPKVFWHEPTKKWVMCLYVEKEKVHTVQFLSSPNLKDWTVMGQTERFFECPDLFELPVDGDAANRKWVLTAANSEYMVGAFDGNKFTGETPKLPGHRGQGFYAPQTFSDIPDKDGRRIQVGWFQTATKGMPFNQSMTIPAELKLVSTPDGPRLTWTPVKELESLRAKTHTFDATTLKPDSENPLAGVQAELVELRAEFEPDAASEVVFTVRGAKIAYDAAGQELVVNGHRASAPLRDGKQRLTIFCDRTGLEVFASHGLTYVPMPFQPKPNNLSLVVEAKAGSAKVNSLQLHELKSAWQSR